MANVRLVKVNKIYDGNVQAVFDFSLDIEDREFIVLVGPSGCGKSTTLRMIAGLEEITTGDLFIDDKFMNNVAPKDREIAMVFQSYALYPQMTVRGNMAYSLKLHHVPKAEIKERVEKAASILGLTDLLDRKPKALSGGQRQRVALGRAIVRNPKVFLMDEPLSNLDAKLRIQMRSEIIRIHNEVQATTIYVTHDQVEAMTMATRIVVMNKGYVQQIGAPTEIYSNPVNMFVAGFIGSPAMNFLHGKINEKLTTFTSNDGQVVLKLDANQKKLLKDYAGKEIVFGIRPEHLAIVPKEDSQITFKANIVELLGDVLNCYGQIGDDRIVLKASSLANIKTNDEIYCIPNNDYVCFFDAETEKRIY